MTLTVYRRYSPTRVAEFLVIGGELRDAYVGEQRVRHPQRLWDWLGVGSVAALWEQHVDGCRMSAAYADAT